MIGCSSSGGHGAPGGEGPPGAGGGGGSGSGSGSGGGMGTLGLGDPAANRQILTSRDENLVMVDLATRVNTPIFAFNQFDNVESVALVGRTAYVGAGDNSINAIDLTTNDLLWDAPFGRYESTSLAEPTVVVRDDTAYGSGVPGVMTAFDLTHNGAVRWTYPLDPAGETDSYFSGVSAPEVTADRVFVGTSTIFDPNYIHAIDRATGARVWRQPIAHSSGLSGAPRLAGDTLLVPAGDLLALDAATGAIKWTLPMFGRGAGTPILAGDRLFVQGAAALTDGRLYCVELATGKVEWTVPAGNDDTGVYIPTLIASARGLLIAGVAERGSGESTTGNGEPFLADAATGTLLWQNPDVSVATSPVFANDQLFFHGQNFKGTGSIDNNVGLIILDASTGAFEEVDTYFQYHSSLSPLVLADNGTFGAGADAN